MDLLQKGPPGLFATIWSRDMDRCLGLQIACGEAWMADFRALHASIKRGILLDSVEMVEAGVQVDSKEKTAKSSTCGKSMKMKWGRSSVG
jgi:hypothetical protein